MKIINYGKVNDCIVYAMHHSRGLTPLNNNDMEFVSADYVIYYDSGIYPSITDVEQYICDQVVANDMI